MKTCVQTEWGAGVRVSAGVLRCQGCRIERAKCVVGLACWDGVLQLVHSSVSKCGSDGVAAIDGGVVSVNHSHIARNAHNGVFVQGHDALARVTASHLVSNGANGIAGVHGASVLITRTSIERNAENGAYLSGLPVVARGPALRMGSSMDPGATLNMTGCHVHENRHNGAVILHKGDATLTQTRLSRNIHSGVAVAQARVIVLRCEVTHNEQHGVVADADAFANVSFSNVSYNAQNGVGAYEQGTHVYVARSIIDGNEWGMAANHKAKVTRPKGVKLRNNTHADQVEVKGGRIFRELLGPFHPIFDSPRPLFRDEDEMSDTSTLHPLPKWRFRGQAVPIVPGHVPRSEKHKLDAAKGSEEERDSTSTEEPFEGDEPSDALVSASEFAAHDDWELDPFILDEETGKRKRSMDDDDVTSSSILSEDHGIDDAKPFSAVVESEDDDAADL